MSNRAEQKREYDRADRQRRKVLSGVRIDREQYARIEAKAKRDGATISETVRTLIEWGLEDEQNA